MAQRSRTAILAALALGLVLVLFGARGPGHGAAQEEDGAVVEGGLVSSPGGGAVDEHRIVVRYRPNAAPGAVKKLEDDAGVVGRSQHARSGLVVAELPAQANPQASLARFKSSPLVLEAGFARTAAIFDAPNDPNYPRQWHMHDTEGGLRAEAAWTLAPNRGAGVVVAVIDTGVAYESRVWNAPGGTQTFSQAPDLAGVAVVAPWDFANGDPHANDDHGHGTHVAGTILQATNNGVGQAGVASGASLMPIKVLDNNGSGDGANLVEAIYYAVDNGADVINMSLGFSGSGAPDAQGNVCTEIVGLGAALEYAHAHGVVVVAATGNDGASTVACPAAYPTVIAVGATRFDGQVTFYSNHGSAIDVTAPGGDPQVDQNGDGYGDGVLQQTFCLPPFWLAITRNYTSFCDVFSSGTSMAAPHVAGVAALLLGESPGISPASVRQHVEASARDRGTPGWDSQYGWGIVDAAGAVASLKGVPVPEITPPPVSPTPTPIPAPAAPTDLLVELAAAGTAKLTWIDNATDEQYYHVERSTDGSSFAQVAILVANATSFTNYNLDAETTYWYRVRASSGIRYSGYSNVASVTTAPPPAAPSNLSATALGADSIRLTWTDNAGDEQYYRVERSPDGTAYTQVAILLANTTMWTNTGLQPETTYHYRVRASAGNAYSAYSNTALATTSSAPAAPGGLAAVALGPDSIRLTWTDNATDEQYYRVERSLDGVSFSQVAILLANTTMWTNSGLSAESTYYFRVRASAGTVYSAYSNVASATTTGPPAAPSNLTAAALGADSIRLTWTDNATTEQYYSVERSTDGVTFAQAALLLANATTWTNYSLQPGTTYYYRVRATVGSVASAYSNVATATTAAAPAAPTNLTATMLTATSVKLTWTDNATNEQYYRVERSTDGVAFSQVAILLANTTSWTNAGLQSGVTYYYRVRASAGLVYSGYSNTVSVTIGP